MTELIGKFKGSRVAGDPKMDQIEVDNTEGVVVSSKTISVMNAYVGEHYAPQNRVEGAIFDTCAKLAEMLIDKNRAYGNSALEPVRIFSNADPTEQLKVRIDDKLSRIVKGGKFPGDNDVDDLLGYLILLKISQSRDKIITKES